MRKRTIALLGGVVILIFASFYVCAPVVGQESDNGEEPQDQPPDSLCGADLAFWMVGNLGMRCDVLMKLIQEKLDMYVSLGLLPRTMNTEGCAKNILDGVLTDAEKEGVMTQQRLNTIFQTDDFLDALDSELESQGLRGAANLTIRNSIKNAISGISQDEIAVATMEVLETAGRVYESGADAPPGYAPLGGWNKENPDAPVCCADVVTVIAQGLGADEGIDLTSPDAVKRISDVVESKLGKPLEEVMTDAAQIAATTGEDVDTVDTRQHDLQAVVNALSETEPTKIQPYHQAIGPTGGE